MGSVTRIRRCEVDRLLHAIARWARTHHDIRGAALVGSWACGAQRDDSDVDIVLLTERTAPYLKTDEWARDLGAEAVLTTRRWGVLTDRRLRMPTGLQVDVGVVSPSWADTEPLDPGTADVAADGLVSLYDPDSLLGKVAAAVARR